MLEEEKNQQSRIYNRVPRLKISWNKQLLQFE